MTAGEIADELSNRDEITGESQTEPQSHHRPNCKLGEFDCHFVTVQGAAIKPYALGAITLKQPLDRHKRLAEKSLRASVAAPHPTCHGSHRKQRDRCGNQRDLQEISLLRLQHEIENKQLASRQIQSRRGCPFQVIQGNKNSSACKITLISLRKRWKRPFTSRA